MSKSIAKKARNFMKNRLQNEGKIDAEMCDFLFFSRKGHFAKTAIILGLFAKKQGSASKKKTQKMLQRAWKTA